MKKTFVTLVVLMTASFAQANEPTPYLECRSTDTPMKVTVEKLCDNRAPERESYISDLVARAPTYQFKIKVEKRANGALVEYTRKGQGYTSESRVGKITLFPGNAGQADVWEKPENLGTLRVEECNLDQCAGLRGILSSDGLPAVELICDKQ